MARMFIVFEEKEIKQILLNRVNESLSGTQLDYGAICFEMKVGESWTPIDIRAKIEAEV